MRVDKKMIHYPFKGGVFQALLLECINISHALKNVGFE